MPYWKVDSPVQKMAISNGWQIGKHAGALADTETYHAAAAE